MAIAPKLDQTVLVTAMRRFPKWQINEAGKAEREFKFRNFQEAFAFISRVALVAEAQQHHPELYNLYNKVRLQVTTILSGGLTEKDIAFINAVDQFSSDR